MMTPIFWSFYPTIWRKKDLKYFAAMMEKLLFTLLIKTPHLIILDVMMPVMDGMESSGEIRKKPGLDQTLIVFLTARGEDYSQIAGFEAGADDYIVKSIKPKVLISRIKALLKRGSVKKPMAQDLLDKNSVLLKGLKLDRERFLIFQKGKEIFLPKKEFELLALLTSKPGKVFSREEIFTLKKDLFSEISGSLK